MQPKLTATRMLSGAVSVVQVKFYLPYGFHAAHPIVIFLSYEAGNRFPRAGGRHDIRRDIWFENFLRQWPCLQ